MEHAAGIRGDAHASQGADARRGTRRGDGASGLHFQPVWRGGLGSTRMGEVHHRVSPRVLATEPALAHPRGSGTFSRILGSYVRECQVISLMEALRRASLVPAQILEEAAPQMKSKGRLQVGADADIIIFDPQTVTDRATYENPRLTSVGMYHVLVNGQFVIKEQALVREALPGHPVRGPLH